MRNTMAITRRRHPKALPYLFLTEMWERFGFYVVQGMLVLYMSKGYGFSDEKSFTISGFFMALVYVSPMVGGYLADRILGFKQAIIWGAVFLIIGYGLLAEPSTKVFYVGLATIVVGNGLFKPNISTLLGALYPPGDTARDVGFTIFYIGINLGVLLAGTSSGYIKDHYGWHAGFGLASIGLMIGLITFAAGLKWGEIHYKNAQTLIKSKFFLSRPLLITYCLLTIAAMSAILQNTFLSKWLLPIAGIVLLFFVFILAYKQEPRERDRLLILNILIISSVIFWMIFLQLFFSATLFIERLVNREAFGIQIPTTVFYSLESAYVILFGPIMAILWDILSRINQNPSSFLKFVLALVLAGLGFLVLAISTSYPDANHLVSPLWVLLSYFLITVGELLLSPIGLSAVTLLSPPHLTGMMMGIWFVALGLGGYFAGVLAKLSCVPENITNVATLLPIYHHAFMAYFWLAAGVAAILFLVQALVRKKLEE
jgi:POT family proton-dependent oligopeptide transporter